jgi:hypothetical protein
MTALPLSATEQARLDAIEAAPAEPESVRERVARALYEQALDGDWSLSAYRDHYRRLADVALDVLRGPSSDAVLPMCWDLAPALNFDGVPTQQYRCELPHGHGGAHRSSEGNNPDLPVYWMRASPSSDAERLRQTVERVLALADKHTACCQFVAVGVLRDAVTGTPEAGR